MLGLFGTSLALGYWASRSLAPEKLREQVERTLASVLGDVRVAAVGIGWRRGLRIEARGIELREAGAVPFAIDQVELGIGIESLWEGRPVVKRLAFYGVVTDVARPSDGVWRPELMNRWFEAGSDPASVDVDGATHWATQIAKAAERAGLDQIELRDSAIRFSFETSAGTASVSLSELALTATVEDGATGLRVRGRANLLQTNRPGRLQLIARLAGPASRADLELGDVELGDLLPWLRLWGGEDLMGATGRANGTLSWVPEADFTRLNAELEFEAAELWPERGPTLRIGAASLRTVALIRPGSVQIADLDLGVGQLALSGHLEAHFPAAPRDGTLEGVLRLAPCSLAAFRELGDRVGLHNLVERFDRVRSGTIERAKLTLAATRLRQLETWLEQPAIDWPAGLRLELRASEFEVDLEAKETLRKMAGQARIDRGELALSGTGRIGDRPLPALDLTIEGWRALAVVPSRPSPPAPVPALPGRIPLTEWIIDQIDPELPPFADQVDLRIDWLDHPALFWRLERTEATLRPERPGIGVLLHQGLWGGVPLSGAGRLLGERPTQRIELQLRVHESASTAPLPEPREFRPRDGVHWASASFDAAVSRVGEFAAKRVAGDLVLAETSLLASGLEIEMVPRGSTLGFLSLDLSEPDRVPATFGFQMEDASLSAVLDGIGADGENWDGVVVLAGQLDARLVPEQPLLESLSGPISGHARNGEFRRHIPWALAIAAASETFNPFGARDVLPYDAIDLELELERGRVDVRSFSLKGPTLRLVGTGSFEVLEPGVPTEVVMGVFLFRGVDVALSKIPILGSLFLGSDESLVPAYFSLTGPYANPSARLIPIKTIMSGPAGIVVDGVPNFVVNGLTKLRDLFVLQPDAEAPEDSASSPDSAP